MTAPIPRIEITDHGNTTSIGRPHSEPDAADAVNGRDLRAQAASELEMASLIEEMEIQLAEE
jgi:hypothetical protein